MFWLFLTLLAVAAFIAVSTRRKRYESVEEEPWRRSLQDDDEPLDWDEARRAESEWRREEAWDADTDDEPWRS